MVSGNHNLPRSDGASAQQGSKMPDLPHRESQRQTIPIEEEEDLPPAYEEGSRRNTRAASAANNSPHRPTPDAYRPAVTAAMTAAAATPARPSDDDPDGYPKTDPMHWDLKERRGDWTSHDHEPGCLCSNSGGLLCSTRGGVMCSDRGGFFCSDRDGMFFSDRGGLWCSDLGATFFSSGGGEANRKRGRRVVG
ncbi:hypothetical protein SODALDRAFT_148818 [Sodiomyces alkalinus F11]|uniref:Uncharacterized protein n=1 Tax=Sodiomyces alkalinus (strain CBS 110278 / VKM F-3762 / F11) TaxID=1314773 RepID=A0A3N2PX01_SODAK|nr:hypothetical protein SODALDRAFT_148818 [Sodiomyces alkalinus F11]ROT38936.1 hypothetical protein SODALDRAFT_148818 [Sodiomyces alkalinus F11]